MKRILVLRRAPRWGSQLQLPSTASAWHGVGGWHGGGRAWRWYGGGGWHAAVGLAPARLWIWRLWWLRCSGGCWRWVRWPTGIAQRLLLTLKNTPASWSGPYFNSAVPEQRRSRLTSFAHFDE